MSDRDLLQEIREHRTLASTEWDDIRNEARKDKLCVAGKPWDAIDPDGKRERQDTKRPFLALDELGQYINQTVNEVRANPRGIKYAPTGNGANDKGAEFYQNHTREIEYRSHAPRVAYPNAFDHAVTHSYGWVQIRTKREHVRTFNQNLWIDPVANPDQVLPDPFAVWPDSRDMKFLFYLEPWTRAEFARHYPKAKASSGPSEWAKLAADWIDSKRVVVGDYWKLEAVMRRLVAYRAKGAQPGTEQIALVDELPEGKLPRGAENLREEDVEDTRVCRYRTNGLELLDDVTKWPGKYIPFVSCFGKILYVDEGLGARRQILSMTRLARDPYMLYCYLASCEAEVVGGIPRSSWVGYEGQFAKPEKWQKANREPVTFLEAKATVPGLNNQQPLPLPTKLPWDPPLQNLAIAKEAARRAIQASMGISPQPTEVQRRNDISGKAWERREAMSQKGSFHFVDHYDLMIERTGVILEDLMTPVLDAARDVPVRKPDDSSVIVTINDPRGSTKKPDGTYADDPIFTKGDYRVTVSTGPANESQREEAANFVDAIVANIQVIAGLAGPMRALKLFAKSVKLKQIGPIGDEIIALLDPPELGKDGKPLPPEIAQLMGENQQLKQILQQAAQEKQAKVVEQDGKFKIAEMQESHEDHRAALERETRITVAELGAKVERMQLFYEERDRVGAQRHDAMQASLERLHESIQAALDRSHDHSLADRGVAGQLAVQAAAPLPDNGAGV